MRNLMVLVILALATACVPVYSSGYGHRDSGLGYGYDQGYRGYHGYARQMPPPAYYQPAPVPQYYAQMPQPAPVTVIVAPPSPSPYQTPVRVTTPVVITGERIETAVELAARSVSGPAVPAGLGQAASGRAAPAASGQPVSNAMEHIGALEQRVQTAEERIHILAELAKRRARQVAVNQAECPRILQNPESLDVEPADREAILQTCRTMLGQKEKE